MNLHGLPLLRFAHGDIGGQHIQQGLGCDGVARIVQTEGQPLEAIGTRVRLPGEAGIVRRLLHVQWHEVPG